MEETKRCARCGRELPLSEFNKLHYGYHHVCKECNKARMKEKADERAKKKEKAGQDALAEARRQRLCDFTPRELMSELKRRGYEWNNMQYVEVHLIPFNDI